MKESFYFNGLGVNNDESHAFNIAKDGLPMIILLELNYKTVWL